MIYSINRLYNRQNTRFQIYSIVAALIKLQEFSRVFPEPIHLTIRNTVWFDTEWLRWPSHVPKVGSAWPVGGTQTAQYLLTWGGEISEELLFFHLFYFFTKSENTMSIVTRVENTQEKRITMMLKIIPQTHNEWNHWTLLGKRKKHFQLTNPVKTVKSLCTSSYHTAVTHL